MGQAVTILEAAERLKKQAVFMSLQKTIRLQEEHGSLKRYVRRVLSARYALQRANMFIRQAPRKALHLLPKNGIGENSFPLPTILHTRSHRLCT